MTGPTTEPKFHVGQAVAVCSKDFTVIIPVTTVVSIIWMKAGRYRDPYTGEPCLLSHANWAYVVADSPLDFLGDPMRFWESSLRPLGPDDYTDVEDELVRTDLAPCKYGC